MKESGACLTTATQYDATSENQQKAQNYMKERRRQKVRGDGNGDVAKMPQVRGQRAQTDRHPPPQMTRRSHKVFCLELEKLQAVGAQKLWLCLLAQLLVLLDAGANLLLPEWEWVVATKDDFILAHNLHQECKRVVVVHSRVHPEFAHKRLWALLALDGAEIWARVVAVLDATQGEGEAAAAVGKAQAQLWVPLKHTAHQDCHDRKRGLRRHPCQAITRR